MRQHLEFSVIGADEDVLSALRSEVIRRRIARLCTRAYQLEQELLDNNTTTSDQEHALQLKQKAIIQEAHQLEQNIQQLAAVDLVLSRQAYDNLRIIKTSNMMVFGLASLSL
jgi:hypothetical protein